MNLIVNAAIFFLMIFVYWFFFAKKEEKGETMTDETVILVKGGYKPSTIRLPKNKKSTLKFLRKDESSCLEEVVLPDFRIRKYLPMNTVTEIEVEPKKSGEFEISCGMNMFHGKIIVE